MEAVSNPPLADLLCPAAEMERLDESPDGPSFPLTLRLARAEPAAGQLHRRTHNMQRSLESIAVGQSLAETFEVVYSVSCMATRLVQRHAVNASKLFSFEQPPNRLSMRHHLPVRYKLTNNFATWRVLVFHLQIWLL